MDMVTASRTFFVELDRNFMIGNRGTSNDPFFIDYKQMNYEQKRTLKTLIKQVLNKEPHEGKNKPSYTNRYGVQFPAHFAGFYLSRNYWHYHSGHWDSVIGAVTYSKNRPHHRTATELAINYLGKVSAPCIHYVWINTQTVRIMAYSEDHIPWILAFDPNNSQRLRPV